MRCGKDVAGLHECVAFAWSWLSSTDDDDADDESLQLLLLAVGGKSGRQAPGLVPRGDIAELLHVRLLGGEEDRSSSLLQSSLQASPGLSCCCGVGVCGGQPAGRASVNCCGFSPSSPSSPPVNQQYISNH